jgi:hypothetical protein
VGLHHERAGQKDHGSYRAPFMKFGTMVKVSAISTHLILETIDIAENLVPN